MNVQQARRQIEREAKLAAMTPEQQKAKAKRAYHAKGGIKGLGASALMNKAVEAAQWWVAFDGLSQDTAIDAAVLKYDVDGEKLAARLGWQARQKFDPSI